MKTFALPIRTLLLALLTACLLPTAHAQWGWKDKDGRTVFSDQPPPAGIADKDVTRRPAGSRPPAIGNSGTASSTATGTETAATATAAAPAAAGSAPKVSGKDAELEKKKKEAEAQEAAKRKAEEQKVAEARKDNCERARRAKASFDSGTRIATTNAKGEREIMDDATRTVESKRLEGIIASDCR
jgi:Domain of unknown function (DUF4124)